ncbi:MAG: hypothetical protein WCC04_00640 [Terriglobales bacterium]
MVKFLQIAWVALAALVLAAPAAAQLKLGDFSTDLTGNISTGYSGDYGNQTTSSHGWDVGGAGTLSGFFYNPNFVSFNASPFLNQSRSNSDYQSISNASGVNFSSNIFGGSHFPGSISYSKAYNSEGNYAVPGVANFTTHGDSQTFGINWSENLPNDPSLSVGFAMGSGDYSVYGTNSDGSNAFHSLNVRSGYTIAGFGLGAYYSNGAGDSLIPGIVSGEPSTEAKNNNSTFGLNANHLLPERGSVSANFSRSNFSSEYLGSNTSGTVDTFSANAGAQPNDKLHLSTSVNYSDNLSGQLIQGIVSAGGVVTGTTNSSDTSHSWDFLGEALYSPLAHFQTTVFAERRMQEYQGGSYGEDSYGANAVYGHFLWGGNFNIGGSIADNTADGGDTSYISFGTSASYNRRIGAWAVGGSFSYSENAQTLLINYTTSFYSYGGNVRRRIGHLNVGVGASGGRTGLTGQTGSQNTNESFNGNLGYGRYLTATASYSKASGSALLTGAGLVQAPTQPLPSGLIDLFGGKSYSFGLSSSPVKKLTIGAAFGSSDSNILSQSIASANKTNVFNALFQYQLRKIYLTGGYSRLEQGISSSGLPPEVISSFYIGVSRWFNFF